MTYECPTCQRRQVSENALTCPGCGEPNVGVKAKRHYETVYLPALEKRAEEQRKLRKEREEREAQEAKDAPPPESDPIIPTTLLWTFYGAVGFPCLMLLTETILAHGRPQIRDLTTTLITTIGTGAIIGAWIGIKKSGSDD